MLWLIHLGPDTTIPKLKKRPMSVPTNLSSTTVPQTDQKGKRTAGEDSKAKTENFSASNSGQTVAKPKVSSICKFIYLRAVKMANRMDITSCICFF